MKPTRKRLFSMLMSGVMTASMLPAYLTQISIPAAADDPPASDNEPDDSPTIDFDYANNNNILNADDALKDIGSENKSNRQMMKFQVEETLKGSYSNYPWRHATWVTSNDSYLEEGSLRTYLESTSDKDKYVALSEGDDRTWTYHSGQEWSPIKITTNKVLDLNGYQFNINYNANINHSVDVPNQETGWMGSHWLTAFEIDEGATLTIIDSSKWRDPKGEGTGRIGFYAGFVDHWDWDLKWYDTRDMFHVNDGNLIIYGGTFEAGYSKVQRHDESNFSWSKLKKCIGTAVELGVNVAKYATGISTAEAGYKDVLKQINLENLAAADSGPKDSESQKNMPSGKNDGRNQSISEKSKSKDAAIENGEKRGTQEEDTNKADKDGKAKFDQNTRVAKAKNEIINQAVNKEGIMGMVDEGFSLIDQIADMCGTTSKPRYSDSIKGTAVRVGSGGTFVSYGGHYIGYGSTPNTRNAVIEVECTPDVAWPLDRSKQVGGKAYIFDGDFEANAGANVFNMYRGIDEAATFDAIQYQSSSGKIKKENAKITYDEHYGAEPLFYKNQGKLADGEIKTDGTVVDKDGNVIVPEPINTANVQVRGGTFHCSYDAMNMAKLEEDDEGYSSSKGETFRMFPGTFGSVNLGVNSFGENLIRDGRIQILDSADGCLVLLDDQEEGYNGLYHYRLFCGDNELRTKSYLKVYPNVSQTNSSYSMQLAYYCGTGKRTSDLYKDDGDDNIRSPYRQMENYFDFQLDDPVHRKAYSVKPNFHYPENNDTTDEDKNQLMWDVYGEKTATSEVWYYPTPLDKEGKPIEDVPYSNACMYFYDPDSSVRNSLTWNNVYENNKGQKVLFDRDVCRDKDWDNIIPSELSSIDCVTYKGIRTNMKYFTYKIYQVDPLTRENLNANGAVRGDDPLITVRYGCAPEDTVLKCKLPLDEAERRIKKIHPEWQGYRAGEMYRIVLEVEEHIGIGEKPQDGVVGNFDGFNDFGQKLRHAKTTTSILFRCFEQTEQYRSIVKDGETIYEEKYLGTDFTPVQWLEYPTSMHTIPAGRKHTVEVRNGKTGMTDWECDTRVFDMYYQWWEVDEKGDPLKLLAGTDNVYVDGLDKHDERGTKYSGGDKAKHKPGGWDFNYKNKDRELYQYANTVDPDDPLAETYQNPGYANITGLPMMTESGKWKWTAEQIHMYSAETTDSDDLFIDKVHSLENNKIDANRTDSCYIPKEMIGKRIRVKVVALNTRWPLAYDKKQTFWSHTMEVCDPNSPEGYLTVTPDANEEFGEDVPATFSIQKLRDFYDDRMIASVTYFAYGKAKQFTFDMDHITSDLSAMPSAHYPKDFSDTIPDLISEGNWDKDLKDYWKNYDGVGVLLGITDDLRLDQIRGDDYTLDMITDIITLNEAPDLYGTFKITPTGTADPSKTGRDQPATVSITSLTGLNAGETISSVYYYIYRKAASFDNLSIYDPKDLPEARYPAAFTEVQIGATKARFIDPIHVSVTTSKGSKRNRSVYLKEEKPTLTGTANITYDEDLDYATYDHPVTISLDDFKGLAWNEEITEVHYKLRNRDEEKVFSAIDDPDVFKNGIPSAVFPNDFYEENSAGKLSNRSYTPYVTVVVARYGADIRETTIYPENIASFQYVVKATSVARRGNEIETFKVSDIQNGKYPYGIDAFTVLPTTAKIGFSFTDYTNTNDQVATLDGNGKIKLTGEPGEATISVKTPDGGTVSKTVKVYQEFDSIQISGIKPPVIGEKLNFDSIKVPEDALYHITDVTWEKGSNPRTRKTVGKDETAAYFEPYTVCVTVEPDEFARVSDNFAYSIYAEQADGTQNNVSEGTKMWRDFDEETNSYLNSYTFEYTYPAQSNHEAKVIDKIYIDFPTEVKEGDNFIKWLEDVNVYTNGYDEGLEFKLTPTFGPDAEAIAKAYGFKATSTTTEQLNYFIKGLQNGLNVVITIPKKLKETGDIFAASSDIKVYINGEEGGNLAWKGDGSLWIMAADSLTIMDGTFDPPKKPSYYVEYVDAVVGEPIKVEELLVTDDPKVTIRPTGIYQGDYWDEYIKYDSKEGTYTPLKAKTSTDVIELTYMVEYDADGDGYPEYQDSNSVRIVKIYATAADVPKTETPPTQEYGTAKIIVQNPDGKEISKIDYKIRSYQGIQDPDGMFFIGFYDADGKTVSEYSFENGKTYYAKTVAADDMEIHAGVNSAYAFIRMQTGSVMNGLHISADGKHYLVGDYLRDLNPDTEYTLYYKYGADGKVYSKSFRTAKQDYGIMIGHDFVTDANPGNLEQDGWHYDADTKTLTLKNFTLNDFGAEAYKIELYGVTGFYTAAIASKDTLTLKLIGENRIAFSDSDLFTSTIFAEKDLTITGNGNLTLAGKAKYGLHSHTGNICLNGTGTLSLKGDYGTGFYGFYPENGEVLYTNGTIAVHPMTETNYKDEPYQFGFLIEAEDAGKLKFSGKVHDIKIEAAGLDGKFEAVAESDFAALIQENIDNLNASKYDAMKCAIRITPVHKDVNKIASAETHESGTCDTSCTYHLSCDCGHIGEETFIMSAEEHSLVKHAAKPATCEEPGTAAYWECEICGERYADAKGTTPLTDEALTVPALGHKLTHHAGVEATCTKAGIIEYWSCETCGERFADENGTVRLFATNLTVPATGHDWVQRFAKPATCETDGTIAHWVCSHCGQCSADKDGTKLLTKEEVTIKAFGHKWSEWTVSKAATETAEGEEYRTCSVCGEVETRVIPVKAVVTTTVPVTTTTAKATTTTAKATTTTAKATTTTAKATTTTAKATTTTAKATTTTAKVTTTTAKVTTTTAKATTTTAKATTTTAKVTTTTAKVTTTTAKATTTTAKATTTTTKVTTTTAKVTTTSAAATTTTTKAATTTAKVTTTSAKTTITTAKATTTTAKVTTTAAKATTTTAKVTTTTAKETTTTAELTTTTEAITTTSETTAQRTTTVITSDGSTDTTPAQTTTTAPPEPEPRKGDVDGNDEVSIEDVQLALKAYTMRVSGKETGLTDRQIKAADVNEDGELSVDDVQNTLIYYVNNTVAGKKLTWEQLLGKQQQAQPRPALLTLHEDLWIDADRYLTEAETS